MTRKTSTYARKRKASLGQFDDGAWVSLVQRCRPYAAESLAHMGIADTMTAATSSMLRVREAYTSIKGRTTPPVNTNAEYVDDLAKWAGRTIALMLGGALAIWVLEKLA